ncbi:MAG: hypothetical protein E7315_02290 [Clostridiales bacterium]|nr:hypothetical protein [Clostridiales bacterium]
MLKDNITHIRNFTKAYLVLPAITGAFTGLWVFAFRVTAAKVIALSADIYALARSSYVWLCAVIAGAVLLGAVISFVLTYVPESKGGGIPVAVAALRGLITFKWLRALLGTFFSSMVTYFVGVPLGSEGPSVQIGAAVGKSVVAVFGKKNTALDRYIMTSGATAGFAVATAAPFSGVFFALEEAHRRFSPTIVMTAVVGAVTGYFTSGLLSRLTGISLVLFDIPALYTMSLKQIWIPVAVGAVTGLFSIGVFWLYKLLRCVWKKIRIIPFWIKISGIFLMVVICGLIWNESIYTGHTLIEKIFSNSVSWRLLVVLLLLRCVLALFSNNAGITGGLFIPIIVWGAIMGALCAKLLIYFGFMENALYLPVVVIGIASCLGAVYKTPVTAVIFAIEVFGGFANIPYIITGVGLAYILTEFFSVSSMNDLVIETKHTEYHGTGKNTVFEVSLDVKDGAFVIGKEIRDVLWPAGCFILSVNHKSGVRDNKMHSGDTVNMRISTYDPDHTKSVLISLLGEQDIDSKFVEVSDER